MEKKLRRIYLKNYNLLIAQDSWKTHYETLLIIFLKEFIKLTVTMDMMTKNLRN